ncbi:MAG: succinate dehydrogenase, cytochrome b556 subunit [Brevundimonas sp.]|nr:MAG: succinate dehydrogenase, cytochrome b556 subunit [Brevundimonas sp.]
MSPHLQIWRWHITMAASILFRVTIGAISVGALFLVAWLAAVAFGPGAYATLLGLAASPPGRIVGFGLTVVLFSFILNGARHGYNDTGNGLTVKSANTLSAIAVWGPIPLAIVFWVILFATGRVAL